MGIPQNVIVFDKVKNNYKKNSQGNYYNEEELKLFLELKRKILNNRKNSVSYNDSVNKNDSIAYNDNVKNIDENISQCELNRECVVLKRKLEYAIPYHSIIYIIITACLMMITLTIWITYFITGISIIPIYICAMVFLGSFGLFITAILSLKDWGAWLKKNGNKN